MFSDNLRGQLPKQKKFSLLSEPIPREQSSLLFSSSSSKSNTENDGKTGGGQPKGFVSTMKRNSLNATKTVRNSRECDENGDEDAANVGETETKAVEKAEPKRKRKVESKKPRPERSFREEAEEGALPPPPMDVVLLLDGSSSITGTVFKGQMLPFCREFAKQMGVTRSGNHLALVQFSGYCRTEFGLTDYFNPERLEEAISIVCYMNGGTRLGRALDYTLKRVMNASSRKEPPITVNKAVVVVTDGASEDDVASPAKALRNDNVQIVVVGVGSGIVQEQLELVADGPANVYTVEDFAQLNKALVGRLKAKICEKVVEEEEEEEKEAEEKEEEDKKEQIHVPPAAPMDAKGTQTPKKPKDETTSKTIHSFFAVHGEP
uniref:VWFA domain-containing protein n=1 Tax=Globodera rostochiensis TaxID=31243 RepID=A0A914HZC2_GLORO